jgi:hypothetical protein
VGPTVGTAGETPRLATIVHAPITSHPLPSVPLRWTELGEELDPA